MPIDISVIIPTYNGEKYLADTINSILKQTFKPKEIIVVDDGSTDNTLGVIHQFNEHVKYINIDNSGVCEARNIGIIASLSPWLAFCDHDDLWLPNKLETQVNLISNVPDIEYIFTNFKTVTDNNWSDLTKFDSLPKSFWEVKKSSLTNDSYIIRQPLFKQILYNQPIFPSTVMLKRSLINKIGGFKEALGRNPSEDLEFTLRCVSQVPIGVVLTPVVGIRKHENNYSNNLLKTMMGQVEILNYVKNNHNLDDELTLEVNNQIAIRSCRICMEAFKVGELDIVKDYFETIPATHRTFKMYLKAFIANLPKRLSESVRRIIVKERR